VSRSLSQPSFSGAARQAEEVQAVPAISGQQHNVMGNHRDAVTEVPVLVSLLPLLLLLLVVVALSSR
jgi:hypothetical protein